MRNKKKLLGILLLGATVGACAFALSGCSNKGGTPSGSTDIPEVDPPQGEGACKHTNLEYKESASATCTTNGNKEYWYCGDCKKYFSDAEGKSETSLAAVTILAGHKYGDIIDETPATCKATGIIAHYHCSACNSDFDAGKKPVTDLVIPLANHTFGTWVEEDPASCTENGVKGHRDCTVCKKHFDADNKEITDLVITAGHNYGTLIDEVPASGCTNGTKAHYHCSVCGTDFDEHKEEFNGLPFPIGNGLITIPAPHNIKDYPAVEATCTVAGHEAYRQCDDCKQYFDEFGNIAMQEPVPAIDPNNHDYEYKYDATAKKYFAVCKNNSDHINTNDTKDAGTADYPYLASNMNELNAVIALGGYIRLTADITTDSVNGILIQNKVTIDLNNHKITNIYSDNVANKPKVVWAYQTAADVTIKNGELVNSTTSTTHYGAYASHGGKLTLDNVNIKDSYCGVYIAKSSTVDLKGGVITADNFGILAYTGTSAANCATVIANGTTINATQRGVQLKKYAKGTLTNCTITTEYNEDINVASDGIDIWSYASLNMTGGSIATHRYGIVGNGADSNVTIETTDVTISSFMGIYHPQMNSTLTINGGSITGTASALEVRSGIVKINASEKGNAVLESTAETFGAEANGNGTTTQGMALAVSQHNTNQTIVVTVNGATLKGIYAIYEKDLMDDITPKDITITLGEGNVYDGCVYSENVLNVLSVAANSHNHVDGVCTRCGDTVTVVSTAAELAAAFTNGGHICLAADIDLTETETNEKTYRTTLVDTLLNLNGHTVTTKGGFRVGKKDNAATPVLTVVNGTINRTLVERDYYTNIATLSAVGNGELIVVNCTVTSNHDTAVSIFDYAKVKVCDSTLKGVYYGLSSNAGTGNYSDALYVEIRNSKLDAQFAGLMWNVPGHMVVEGCEISGIGQAVIARGGTAVISDSTLTKRAGVDGVDDERAIKGDTGYVETDPALSWRTLHYADFETKTWGSGSSVPGYALVVGNRASSYQYATDLTLKNVKVVVEEEADAGKYVYAYGNTNKTAGDPAYGATITYDEKCDLGTIVIGDENLEGGSNVTVNAPAK